jgi:hypothetical protein
MDENIQDLIPKLKVNTHNGWKDFLEDKGNAK